MLFFLESRVFKATENIKGLHGDPERTVARRSARLPRGGRRLGSVPAVLPRADVPGLDHPIRPGGYRAIQRLAAPPDGDRPPHRPRPGGGPRPADAGPVPGRSLRRPRPGPGVPGAPLRRPHPAAPGRLAGAAGPAAPAVAVEPARLLSDDLLEGRLDGRLPALDRRPGDRSLPPGGGSPAGGAAGAPLGPAGAGPPQRGGDPPPPRPAALAGAAAGGGGTARRARGRRGAAGALAGGQPFDRRPVPGGGATPGVAGHGDRPGGDLRRRPRRLRGAAVDAEPHPRRGGPRPLPARGHRVRLLGRSEPGRQDDAARLPPAARRVPVRRPQISWGARAGEADGVRNPSGARPDLVLLPRHDRREPLRPAAERPLRAGAGAAARGGDGGGRERLALARRGPPGL